MKLAAEREGRPNEPVASVEKHVFLGNTQRVDIERFREEKVNECNYTSPYSECKGDL